MAIELAVEAKFAESTVEGPVRVSGVVGPVKEAGAAREGGTLYSPFELKGE